MAHTCETCEQSFETLTRLRLHDCPGPVIPADEMGQTLVKATERGLERGDLVDALPSRPLLPTVIEQWTEEGGVIAAFSVMSGRPDQEETDRIALATVAGAYVLEFFPHDGWIVVRATTAGDHSHDDLHDALIELVQNWQAKVTELVMSHAPDKEAHGEALMREIGREP